MAGGVHSGVQEDTLRAWFDALPVGVLVLDGQRILDLNEAAARLLGGERANLLASSILDWIAPSSHTALEELQAGQSTLRQLSPLARENGERLTGRVLRLQSNDHTVLTLDADRADEDASRRLLLDALPDILCRIDEEGALAQVDSGSLASARARRLAAWVGKPALDSLDGVLGARGALRRRGRRAVERAARTRSEQAFEVACSQTDWEASYECRVVPLEGGESLLLLRDVTEKRMTDERLAIAERLASVGTLAAGVAHELNNPLTSVLSGLDTALEALGRASPEPNAIRQLLEEARQSAHQVRDIVADLRESVRTDADEVGSCPAADVIERVAQSLATPIAERAVLELHLDRELEVACDALCLRQIVLQLLRNAIEALPKGAAHSHRIVVRLERAGDNARLLIRDTGVGIPASLEKRVFDPFFTTKPPGQGTGLGLSMCHRLVTSLDGSIRLESSPGAGSLFEVTLPLSRVSPASKPPQAPRPVAGALEIAGRPLVILIVDDEPLVARALSRILKGAQVIAAHSAEEALTHVDHGVEVDAVVCDLMMPEMTGIELYEEACRRSPRLAQRFVFVSGAGELGEPHTVLTKPPAPEELRAAVLTAALAGPDAETEAEVNAEAKAEAEGG